MKHALLPIAAAFASFGFAVASGPVAAQTAGKWGPHVDVTAKPGTDRALGKAELFMPVMQDDQSLLFLDLRGVASDDPSLEGNFGLGYRHILPESGVILGAYGFYDRRRTEFHSLWNQVTLGAEALTEDWDVRVNGYLPQHGRRLLSSSNDDSVTVNGSSITYTEASLNRYEQAMRGFDGEVGRRVPGLPVDLRLFAGGFHFTADGTEDVTGPRLRLETRFDDIIEPLPGSRLTLGLEGQHDDVRGSQGFAVIRLRIPLWDKEAPRSLTGLDRRMTDPIERDIDIVSTAPAPTREITAQGPAMLSGVAAGKVVYAAKNGTGSGSAADPTDLSTAITQAGPGGVIVLLGNSGPVNGGVSLQSGQTLVSGGFTLMVHTPSGRSAPLHFGGSRATLLNNGNGPAITLADDSAVAGLDIDHGNGAAAQAIYGYNIGGTLGLDGLTIDGGGNRTMVAIDTNRSLNLRIADSAFRSTSTTADLVSLTTANSTTVSTNDISIRGNLFQGGRRGIEMNNLGSVQTADISGNSFAQHDETGIYAKSTGLLSLTAQGNRLHGTGFQAASLHADYGETLDAQIQPGLNAAYYNYHFGLGIPFETQAANYAEWKSIQHDQSWTYEGGVIVQLGQVSADPFIYSDWTDIQSYSPWEICGCFTLITADPVVPILAAP